MAFIKREVLIYVEFTKGDVPAEDVLVWYKERLETLSEDYPIRIIEITHQGNHIYKIDYEYSDDEDPVILDDLIADPDDDGNYAVQDGNLIFGYVKAK